MHDLAECIAVDKLLANIHVLVCQMKCEAVLLRGSFLSPLRINTVIAKSVISFPFRREQFLPAGMAVTGSLDRLGSGRGLRRERGRMHSH